MTNVRIPVWMAATLLAAVLLSGCARKSEPPHALVPLPNAELVIHYGLLRVIDFVQQGVSFKLLVRRDGSSDFRVTCYRLQGGRFLRHGAEENLVGFSEPRLEQRVDSRVVTTHRRSGSTFFFEFLPAFGLVPENGEWQPVGSPGPDRPQDQKND
jgi:hypothetical protein